MAYQQYTTGTRAMTVAKKMDLAKLPPELTGQLPAGNYSFDQLFRFAQVCHASGMFKEVADAAQAFIKIAKGQELGLPPMAAMNAFDIIHDRLFIKPWAIAGMINACGYGYYRVLEQTNERCTILFSKKFPVLGWKDLDPETYTFEEAKGHGLVGRSAHWKVSPANMLYQRCMGRGGARHFPELLGGLAAPVDMTPAAPEETAALIGELCGDAVDAIRVHADDSFDPLTEALETSHATLSRPPTSPIARKEGWAWDVIRAHEDNDALPMALRQELTAALAPESVVDADKAHSLADQVMQWVDQPT